MHQVYSVTNQIYEILLINIISSNTLTLCWANPKELATLTNLVLRDHSLLHRNTKD